MKDDKARKILDGLLTGNQTEAAKQAKVSTKTVQRYKNQWSEMEFLERQVHALKLVYQNIKSATDSDRYG